VAEKKAGELAASRPAELGYRGAPLAQILPPQRGGAVRLKGPASLSEGSRGPPPRFAATDSTTGCVWKARCERHASSAGGHSGLGDPIELPERTHGRGRGRCLIMRNMSPGGRAATRAAGALAPPLLLLLLLLAAASRDAAAQQIEDSVQSGDIFATAALVPPLSSAVHKFMQKPFEMALDFTEAADYIGSLDLADRQQMSRVMYTQTLATKCGEPGNPFDMVYLGLEEGTFLGYFSPTEYTYRPPSGTMADQLSWEPYALDTINGVCGRAQESACDFADAANQSYIAGKACIGAAAACSAVDISGGGATGAWERLDAGRASCEAAGGCRFSAYGGRTWDGKVVSSSCTRAGADVSSCAVVDLTGADASTDLHACESAGDCAYTPADVSGGMAATCTAVCTDTCCDGDLRIYYSADSRGEPVEMTRWRVYDHRARPWYIQQKERFLSDSEAFGWSSVYTFSSSGALGITATAMINDDMGGHGVAAVDYTLAIISQLVMDELLALRVDLGNTWAYIVEVSGSTPGTLMGSSTESVTDSSSGSVTRLLARNSTHPGAALSAAYLDENDWPVVDGVALTQGDTQVEFGTYSFEDRGLVWLIVVGQMTNCSSTDVWAFGKCNTCDSGTEPVGGACIACAAGYAGMGGICAACQDGKQPNTQKTTCEVCPKGTAGKGGQCTECSRLRGEIANSDATACVCPAGTYDSYVQQLPHVGNSVTNGSVQHLFCWTRGKTSDPAIDALNSVSSLHYQYQDSELRCHACPSCVTCESGMIAINAGFGITTDYLHYTSCSGETCEAENALNVYKCDHSGCPGLAANATDASVCKDHHQGILCGGCTQSFYIQNNECKHCGEWSTGGILAAVAVFLAIVAWRVVKAKMEPLGPLDMKVRFWRRVFEKSWPRFNQGWKILAGNFQISASIAANTHIEWPDGIAYFFHQVGSIANLNVLKIPGLACAVTSSFFLRWSVQMLMLPVIIIMCYLVYRKNVKMLVAETASKASNMEPLQQVAVDLSLAVKIGQVKTSISSWAFMSVYLLYPGACSAIFSMFKCRKLDHGAEYLITDMRQPCHLTDGAYDETYLVFLVLAYILVVLYALGIPFVLGFNLYRQREIINENPNYVTLVAFKPLFQFYKPQCYLWEIYFMLQKVVLVGMMGIFEASMMQKMFQVVLSIVVVCAICKTMPSKTQQFNYANIVSQATIVVNFLATILLSVGDTARVGVSSKQIEYGISLGMQLMMMYLIYVIFAKVKEMVRVSSKEVRDELIMMKQLDQGEVDPTDEENNAQENGRGQEAKDELQAADHAIRQAFKFFDEDGSGSVNLYEIQHVLDLFDIHFDRAGRDAIIDLAADMSGHDAVCDRLKEQFVKVDLDSSLEIDSSELKKAMGNPEIDLRPFGWNLREDLGHGGSSVLNLYFEEIDAEGDGSISWDEIQTVCKQRLAVKNLTLSQLQAHLHTVDDKFLVTVMVEDKWFSQYLYPSGLPQKPAPTESDPRATEVDMQQLNRAQIIDACLDSHLPSESMRSLLVRSWTKEEKQLAAMDMDELKAAARKVLVDETVIETVQDDKKALLAEIDCQRQEMSFATFKAIWVSQMHAQLSSGNPKALAVEKFGNPLAEGNELAD
jgi:Ca2+-binding EF-hand superfamily protein